MNKIDMNKKYKTRDGRDVRILCTDANHKLYPVVGIVEMEGISYPSSWTRFGKLDTQSYEKSNEDLIEVKEKETLWLKIYENECVRRFGNLYSAKADKNAIARIKVEYEERQFDE